MVLGPQGQRRFIQEVIAEPVAIIFKNPWKKAVVLIFIQKEERVSEELKFSQSDLNSCKHYGYVIMTFISEYLEDNRCQEQLT